MESFVFLDREGIIVYCSQSFLKMLHLKVDEIIGTSIELWFEPQEGNGFLQWKNNHYSEGRLEYKGTKEIFKYNSEAIIHSGTSDGVFLFIKYIDKALMVELELICPHAFDLNPGLSAISTADTGIHLDVNKAWLSAMGYEKKEVIGKSASELHIWESPTVRETIRNYLQLDGCIENFETRMKTKDKGYLDVIISARKIIHNNRELYFFAAHDITELRKTISRCVTWEQKANNLNKMALTDGLTGISNRRHFDQVLDSAWKKCNRSSKPIALIIIDIDFFKSYNDCYGHVAGDRCLREVAQALKESIFRPGDVVCRYGGEEFCCILPETDAEGAFYIAKRLQQSVNSLNIPHEESPIAPYLTISMGVASMVPETDEKGMLLIEMADQFLYKAKATGRAKIEVRY